MGKNTFFTGQPIFTQLLSLIPKVIINKTANTYAANRYCKKFFFYDHLVTMLFSCFHSCTGLREVTTGMQAEGDRLRHLGLKNTPRKSTFADSNVKRSSKIFEELFHQLVSHFFRTSPDSWSKKDFRRLFIIDSTTFTLFNNIMKGAGSYQLAGKKKGGAKAHVVLDAEKDIPYFVLVTEARMADKGFLNSIYLPPNTRVVMDRGYNHYGAFLDWSRRNILWYTRINKAAVYQIMEELPLSKEQIQLGVIDDQIIKLGNPVTRKKMPLQDARLVKYKDRLTGKVFQFITNDFNSTAFEIAETYRRRWQIEIFFKRLKQNFPLKYFLGDSENAVRIQIWCSLITDLIVKVIMDKAEVMKKKWSFANLSSLIKLHLGTYIDLIAFLKNPERSLLNYKPPATDLQTQFF